MNIFILILLLPIIASATSLVKLVDLTDSLTHKKITIVENKIDYISCDTISSKSKILMDGQETKIKESPIEISKLMNNTCFIDLKLLLNHCTAYVPINKIIKIEKQSISSGAMVFIKGLNFETKESQEEILKKIENACESKN